MWDKFFTFIFPCEEHILASYKQNISNWKFKQKIYLTARYAARIFVQLAKQTWASSSVSLYATVSPCESYILQSADPRNVLYGSQTGSWTMESLGSHIALIASWYSPHLSKWMVDPSMNKKQFIKTKQFEGYSRWTEAITFWISQPP